jgi:hypothetical protein
MILAMVNDLPLIKLMANLFSWKFANALGAPLRRYGAPAGIETGREFWNYFNVFFVNPAH